MPIGPIRLNQSIIFHLNVLQVQVLQILPCKMNVPILVDLGLPSTTDFRIVHTAPKESKGTLFRGVVPHVIE